jgi:putative DNA primase/helicase
MLGAVTRVGNPEKTTGVHRTFLRGDGLAKADLREQKMSLGHIRGAAVRLAPIASKLAVCEGIETGLSFMQATSIPTWAALSAAGMQALVLPPEVREVVIATDPDSVGIKAARLAAHRWHAEGRGVRIIKPPQGLDFNDLARAP